MILTSTWLRDVERCPERGTAEKTRVTSLPAAAGVAFDDLLRRDLGADRDEDLAWLSPLVRPQARLLGAKLLAGYQRSGAYDALLGEGVLDPDPARAWGVLCSTRINPSRDEDQARTHRAVLRQTGTQAWLMAGRPDAYVGSPRRVLDYKTSGVLRGANPVPGYVARWRGGVDLGPDPNGTGPPGNRPDWWLQLETYAALVGTRHVGVDLVCVRNELVEVACYRWQVEGSPAQRYLAAVRAYEEREAPVRGPHCYAYRRRCRLAEECPAWRDA